MAENREVFILIFGQELWFGDRTKQSLINPYQCRAFGVNLCDDPVDPNGREMGFNCEGAFIPLCMVPTDDKLENCTKIYMSDEEDWNPSLECIFKGNRNVNTALAGRARYFSFLCIGI